MANLQLFGYLGLALSFTAAVVAPLFAGCGSSVSSGNGGSGGQGVGGHAVGGHGGHANVMGGAGGGGAVDCPALVADDDAAPVAVRFINHTAADVYLGSAPGDCSFAPVPYVITDAQGAPIVVKQYGSCSASCATLTCTQTCASTSTCPPHSATRIAPQGTLNLSWSGNVPEKRMLPGMCFGGNCGNTVQCTAWVNRPAGALTFGGTVWTEMHCQFGGNCGCTPDASGTCIIKNGEATGNIMTVSATLAPGATSVDVIFK